MSDPVTTHGRPVPAFQGDPSRYVDAIEALVTAVEQFIRLGAIDDPAAFVHDVACRLTKRFPVSGNSTRANLATNVVTADNIQDGILSGVRPPLERTTNSGEGITVGLEGAVSMPDAATPASVAPPIRKETVEVDLRAADTVPEKPTASETSSARGGANPSSAKRGPAKSRRATDALIRAVFQVPMASPLSQESSPVSLPSPEVPRARLTQRNDTGVASPELQPVLPTTQTEVASPTIPAADDNIPPPALSAVDMLSIELPPETPAARSNVRPVSNVYLRNESILAHSDTEFRRQIRGKEWIKSIYASTGILNPTLPISSQDLSSLSFRQREVIKDFTCIYGCGRRDFGYFRLPNGKIKWGSLAEHGRECMCRRADRPAASA